MRTTRQPAASALRSRARSASNAPRQMDGAAVELDDQALLAPEAIGLDRHAVEL